MNKPTSYKTTCPLCYGTGTITEEEKFSLDNHYIKTAKCYYCNGTGLIEQELNWLQSGNIDKKHIKI